MASAYSCFVLKRVKCRNQIFLRMISGWCIVERSTRERAEALTARRENPASGPISSCHVAALGVFECAVSSTWTSIWAVHLADLILPNQKCIFMKTFLRVTKREAGRIILCGVLFRPILAKTAPLKTAVMPRLYACIHTARNSFVPFRSSKRLRHLFGAVPGRQNQTHPERLH